MSLRSSSTAAVDEPPPDLEGAVFLGGIFLFFFKLQLPTQKI